MADIQLSRADAQGSRLPAICMQCGAPATDEIQAKTMTVRTPLCAKHAHGWFTWSTLEAKAITDESIVLKGVSEQFVQAWQQQQQHVDRPQQEVVVRVRCQSCQALNAEAAKFCDQCGTAI